MFTTALLLTHLAACQPSRLASPVAAPRVASDTTLQGTFEKGQTFAEFVTAATSRREGWLRLQKDAVVRPALIARARSVGGRWQLLVVARDGCGDSMNSVPYAARLADSVPGLSLRVVSPEDGATVAREHRTQDGRPATPTFVLLDSAGRDVGCLVELPKPLRDWTNASRGTISDDSLHAYRNTFYAKDQGLSVTTELVEVLEAARAGTPRCDRLMTR